MVHPHDMPVLSKTGKTDRLSLGVTAHQLRQYCAAQPIRPYEVLETSPADLATDFAAVVEEELANGYGRDGFNIPSVSPPLDWSAHNRSFSVHLHGWDAITRLLTAHSSWGEPRYLTVSLAHIRDWMARFQQPVIDRNSDPELDALVTPQMPDPWNDMAVGKRCFRIAYLLDFLARQPAADDAELEYLWRSLRFHMLLLGREHFFRKHTNHGLYQALGHLAAARRFADLPGMRAEFRLAEKRLRLVLQDHFSSDGVHKEHSPGYHYMVMGTILNARRFDLLQSRQLRARTDRAERALSWMIKPELSLAAFGDTDAVVYKQGKYSRSLHRDKQLRYIVSGGETGRVQKGVKAYREGGYAFARLYAPGTARDPKAASYLAQIAAFHSRTHKHADHLSFVWYDKGSDILVDPGRFAYAGLTKPGSSLFEEGFWYDDPRRIYVERTRAHNCVEIDGRDYPRKKIKPFGSALRYAGEQGGMAVTDCETTHFRTIQHWRGLIMAPGEFLIVLDHLRDRLKKPHDFRQWFQLAPHWETDIQSGQLVATRHGLAKSQLHVASLIPQIGLEDVARGQTEPQMQGWFSDAPYSLVPSSSFSFLEKQSPSASFATLFCLRGTPDVHPLATRFNVTMTAGGIRWRSGRKVTHLKFRRNKDSHLQVTRVC